MSGMTKTHPSTDEVEVQFEGQSFTLPLVRGTEGETAIDISGLRSSTGLITLDPGFGNTGSTKSAITFVDGEKGILRFRGYPIEELAEHSTFLEVAQLLIHGELPSAQELEAFKSEVTSHTMLHEAFRGFFGSLPTDAHPMPTLAAAVGALSTFYEHPETQEEQHEDMVRLMAKMPTLAAWSYKHSLGQPFVYPRNDLSYAANFLNMMFSTPCEDLKL